MSDPSVVLDGLDPYARAHALGEDPPGPPVAIDHQRRDALQRQRDEEAARARGPWQPRSPRVRRRGEPLSFPERHAREVFGSRELTLALDLLRVQLNRHASDLSKARRKRIETAVADLEAALTDGRGKTGG